MDEKKKKKEFTIESTRAAVVNDKGCALCVLCEYNLFLCLLSLSTPKYASLLYREGIKGVCVR